MMDIGQIVLNFDTQLPQLVVTHASLVYLVACGVVFLQIGILPFAFLPSNPFLFVCGAVWAASQLNILLLLACLFLAAALGSLCGYWLGGVVGQKFFVDYLKWPNQASLDKTRHFYDKHGEKGFLFSLFFPIIRTLSPFLAGMASMSFVKFTRSATLGAMNWVLVCVMLGYFFGNIPIIKNHLGLIAISGLGLVILVVLLKKLWNAYMKLGHA